MKGLAFLIFAILMTLIFIIDFNIKDEDQVVYAAMVAGAIYGAVVISMFIMKFINRKHYKTVHNLDEFLALSEDVKEQDSELEKRVKQFYNYEKALFTNDDYWEYKILRLFSEKRNPEIIEDLVLKIEDDILAHGFGHLNHGSIKLSKHLDDKYRKRLATAVETKLENYSVTEKCFHYNPSCKSFVTDGIENSFFNLSSKEMMQAIEELM
ncbi:MAG: hypothetical protein ACE5RF_09325, partial [Nitrosarchaeum sp.]